MIRFVLAAGVAVVALTAGHASAQDLDFRWKAYIDSDVRVTLPNAAREAEEDGEVRFERLETSLGGEIQGRYRGFVIGKAHLEVTYTEFGDVARFSDLISREALDPWRFESDALFVEFTNVGLDGLDIAIGRRQEIWGTADRFHPTSNLNPLDVEDPLLFGETIANEMISIRYSPWVTLGDEDEPWFEELSFQVVVVPYFKPAQLPASAGIAFTDVDEQFRRATTDDLRKLVDQQRTFLNSGATVDYDVRVARPDFNIENVMVGARAGWKLFGVDMSLSYFRGFDDFPRAEEAVVTGDSSDVDTQITLSYPRMQVLGVDMATSIPWLDGLGLWGEVAVVFHDDLYVTIDGTRFAGNQDGSTFANAPTREHEGGAFVRAVAGVDYTPFSWWYINVQYLHGFVDEFGQAMLGDYIVGGMDFKFWRDRITLRTFAIIELESDAEDVSAVLFPQLIVQPFPGAVFTAGAFLFMGDEDTKFGSPVAGRSTFFVKGGVTF